MKKYYKIEVYEDGEWWVRYANHEDFSSLDDARTQLNAYKAPTRIVGVSETVVETHSFLNKEDLIKLLEDHPILVTENADIYRVHSIHPSLNEFKLKNSKLTTLYVCSLEEAYITNGKLSIKDITEKRFEYSYFKHTLLE
jgi:hypothetical protein